VGPDDDQTRLRLTLVPLRSVRSAGNTARQCAVANPGAPVLEALRNRLPTVPAQASAPAGYHQPREEREVNEGSSSFAEGHLGGTIANHQDATEPL